MKLINDIFYILIFNLINLIIDTQINFNLRLYHKKLFFENFELNIIGILNIIIFMYILNIKNINIYLFIIFYLILQLIFVFYNISSKMLLNIIIIILFNILFNFLKYKKKIKKKINILEYELYK